MSWYKSKKGWISAVLAAAWLALDHWGRAESAISIYRVVKDNFFSRWRLFSPFVPPILFVLALVFFELDRRRAKRPRPYDLNTLKGRTLRLKDEIESYMASVPDTEDKYAGATRQKEIEYFSGSNLKVMKLHHGWDLRFADRLKTIFNEFGERNVRDHGLIEAMNYQTNNGNMYRLVIERLTELAERPEANY
jgi:hypothetical protein